MVGQLVSVVLTCGVGVDCIWVQISRTACDVGQWEVVGAHIPQYTCHDMTGPQHDGNQEAKPGANGVCINLRLLHSQFKLKSAVQYRNTAAEIGLHANCLVQGLIEVWELCILLVTHSSLAGHTFIAFVKSQDCRGFAYWRLSRREPLTACECVRQSHALSASCSIRVCN